MHVAVPVHVTPLQVAPIHVGRVHVGPEQVGIPMQFVGWHVARLHVLPEQVGVPEHVIPLQVIPTHVGRVHVDPEHVGTLVHVDPEHVGTLTQLVGVHVLRLHVEPEHVVPLLVGLHAGPLHVIGVHDVGIGRHVCWQVGCDSVTLHGSLHVCPVQVIPLHVTPMHVGIPPEQVATGLQAVGRHVYVPSQVGAVQVMALHVALHVELQVTLMHEVTLQVCPLSVGPHSICPKHVFKTVGPTVPGYEHSHKPANSDMQSVCIVRMISKHWAG